MRLSAMVVAPIAMIMATVITPVVPSMPTVSLVVTAFVMMTWARVFRPFADPACQTLIIAVMALIPATIMVMMPVCHNRRSSTQQRQC